MLLWIMQTYQAYLLRLWRESDADPWRAVLEDAHTGERIGFGRVDQLLAYLTQQLAPNSAAAPDSPPFDNPPPN